MWRVDLVDSRISVSDTYYYTESIWRRNNSAEIKNRLKSLAWRFDLKIDFFPIFISFTSKTVLDDLL